MDATAEAVKPLKIWFTTASMDDKAAMPFKGSATFTAAIKEGTTTFPRFSFACSDNRVTLFELECDAVALQGRLTFEGVPRGDGEAQIRNIIEATLDRLAVALNLGVGPAICEFPEFEPMNPEPGTIYPQTGRYALTGFAPKLRRSVSPSSLVPMLEGQPKPGENLFSLYRQILLFEGAGEQFLLLYSMLQLCIDDRQQVVDDFIRANELGVRQTPFTRTRADGTSLTVTETIYSRIRNEIGHRRPGVDIVKTREEAGAVLDGLRKLVLAAIEQA